MKYIYKLLISFLFTGIFASCETKQDVWDTGIASPYHDCSIMEYLRGDKYNWELTEELIEHAGLNYLRDRWILCQRLLFGGSRVIPCCAIFTIVNWKVCHKLIKTKLKRSC